MSREIDERIVQMTFDNKNFERNAHQTMDTLDQVDEKLKFKDASKGFKDVEKAANNVKMSGLVTVLETVHNKFSGLEIAAISALNNITNRTVDTGAKLVKSLSVDQITAGYSKYEQKTAAVQTIMNATGKTIDEVSKSLEKLNWFTDETSYDFVDMVDNIGKFTSAGVDLDSAVTAMEGIASEAALAGRGINEASRAMFNFSQALGKGYVQTIDWMSISGANLDTVEFKKNIIDVALAQGTLVKSTDGLIKTLEGHEVSVSDFASALKDQWFTSDVLIKTLGRYGEYADAVYEKVTETGLQCAEAMELVNGETMELGERAFKAGQVAKTLTDAINATKDAVSTGWMTTFETLFGNFEEAKVVWTELSGDLWDIFAASGEVRNELLKAAFEGGSGWGTLTSKMEAAGISVKQFETDLEELARNEGRNVDQLIEQHESFEAAIKSGALSDLIPKLFRNYVDSAKEATVETKDLTTMVAEYQDLVDRIYIKGEFGIGEARFAKLNELGYDAAFVQQLVNKAVQGGKVSVEDFSDAQLEQIGYTEEQIKALRELADEAENTGSELNDAINNLDGLSTREVFIDSFRNIIASLKSVLETVKEAWEAVFPAWTVETVRDLVKRFHDFTEALKPTENQLDNIRSIAKGLFSVLSIVKQVVTALVQNGFNLLQKILRYFGIDVGSATASIGELLYKLDQWLKEGNKINTVISTTIDFLAELILAVKDTITAFFGLPEVEKIILNVKDAFKVAYNFISENTKDLRKIFADFFEDLKNLDSFSFDGIKETFDELFTKIGALTNGKTVGGDGNFWGKALSDTNAKMQEFVQRLKEFWIAVKDTVSRINPLSVVLISSGLAILIFTKRLIEITDTLSKTLTPITTAVKSFLSSFSGLFKSVGEGVNKYLRAVAFKEIAASVLKLSAAVVLLAAAFFILAKVPKEGIIGASIAFTVLIGVVAGLALVVRKNRVMLKQLATLFLTISSSVFILVAAMKAMDEVTNGFWPVIATIGLFSGAIILLSKFVKQFPAGMSLASVGIIAMAGAMSILIHSLSGLNDVDTTDIWHKIGAIGVIMVGFIGIIAVANKLGGIGTMFSGIGMMGFVLSLQILFYQLNNLAKFDFTLLKDKALEIGTTLLAVVALVRLAGKASAGIGIMVVGIAAAIAILVPVIKSLGNIPKKALLRASLAVAGLAFVFGLVIELSHEAGENAVKAGAMIMMMSAAIAGLSLVIWGLGLLDPKVVWQGTGVVAGLMSVFGLILLASSKAEKAAKTIIAINVTLTIFAIAIGIISNFTKIGPAIAIVGSLSVFAVALSVLLRTIAKSSGLNNVDKIKNVTTVIDSFLLMFSLLSGVIIAASAIPGAKLSIAIASFTGITAMIVAFQHLLEQISSSSGFGEDKIKQVNKIIDSFLLMFSLLSGVIIAASAIPGAKLGIVITVFTGVIGMMVTFQRLIEQISGLSASTLKADKVNQVIKLFGLMAAIATGIGAVIAVVALIPSKWQNIVAIFAGMSVAILAIAQAFNMLSGVDALKDNVLVQLTGLTIAAALIGGLITAIAGMAGDNVNITTLIAVTLSTSVLINALALAVKILNTIPIADVKVAWSTTGQLVVLAGVLVGLFAAMNLLNTVHVEGLITKIAAASLALLALVGIGALIGKVGKFIDPVTMLKATGGLIILVAGILAALTLIGKIDQWTNGGFSKAIEDAMDLLGDAIGSFIAALTDTSLSALPTIGGYLGEFADNSKSFFDLLGTLSFGKLASLAMLPLSIKALTMAPIDVLMLPALIAGVRYYGEALKIFAASVGSFTTAEVEKIDLACQAGNLLAEHLKNIPNFGGLVSLFTGDNTWIKFSEGLADYGTILANYGSLMSDKMSSDMVKSIKRSTEAGEALAVLLDNIPNFGGLAWLIAGDNTWVSFSRGLKYYGESLANYGDSAALIEPNVGAIKASVEAGKALSDLLKATPNEQSLGSKWLFGDENEYKLIYTGLEAFGEHMANFSSKVSAIDVNAIMSSVDAGKALTDLLNATPNAQTVFSKLFFGDEHSYSLIYEGLEKFGESMVDFGDTISDLDTSDIGKIKIISIATKNLVEALKTVNGVWDFHGNIFDGGGLYSQIIYGLDAFADALVALSDRAELIDIHSIRKIEIMTGILVGLLAEDKYNAMKSYLPKIGNLLIDFANDLDEFDKKVEKLDLDRMKKALEIDVEKKVNVVDDRDSGGEHDDPITDPERLKKLREMEEDIWEEELDLSQNSTYDFRERAEKQSEYVVDGFTEGLKNKKEEVTDSGESMAETYLNSFNETLGINSPAKELIEAAKYCIEGFIQGSDEGKRRLAEKSKELGSTVLESLGLEDIAAAVKSGGGDIGSLLLNAVQSKLGFDASDMTGIFGDFSSMGSDLGNIFGSSFTDALSSMSGGAELIQNETLEKAKAEYDELLADFGAGRIVAAEYEERYTDLIKKYTAEQDEAYKKTVEESEARIQNLRANVSALQAAVDSATDTSSDAYKQNAQSLNEYTQALENAEEELNSYKTTAAKANIALQLGSYSEEQMTAYISNSIQGIQDTYENSIAEVQSKMDSMISNWSKSYGDMITYTTNRDVYDKKVSGYEQQISDVNLKLEESKRLYGENSAQAQRYENQLQGLQLELQSYKNFYEREKFDDDEIVGVAWNKDFLTETEKLTKYTSEMTKLTGKGVSQSLLDYISEQDVDTALATLQWLNTQSAEELKKQDKIFTDYEAALKAAGKTTYADAITKAEEEYQNGINTLYESLPDHARDIALKTIEELSVSFSEETEKTLSIFGKTGKDILEAMKRGMGFGELEEEESINEAMYEAGKTTADSVSNGFTVQIAKDAETMAQANAEVQANVANAGIDAAVKAIEENAYKVHDAYDKVYSGATESTNFDTDLFSVGKPENAEAAKQYQEIAETVQEEIFDKARTNIYSELYKVGTTNSTVDPLTVDLFSKYIDYEFEKALANELNPETHREEYERILRQHYKDLGVAYPYAEATKNAANTINAATSRNIANAIHKSRKSQEEASSAPSKNSGDNAGKLLTFVQNNYSPKALTRSEVRNRERDAFALANSRY